MTEQVKQWICIKFWVRLEHSSVETIWMIEKATAMGNWWLAASSQQHAHSCITSQAEFLGKTSNHPDCRGLTQLLYSPDLAPYNFWLFAKLKSSLKRKRFQTVDEIQGQLMVTGKTLWGPKVPTLKGTEASLSSVQCFLCLVSSSVSVSIFHITWLDTF